MKKTLLFTVTGFFVLFSALPVQASWAAPSEIVWGKSGNGKFEFKRDHSSGTVTVYKTGERDTPLWSRTFPGFSNLFSMVYLSNSGETLLHLRGNHQVNSLEETAVHVARPQEGLAAVPVKDLVDQLSRPAGPVKSTSPSFLWLSRFGEFSDTSFSLTNAKGEQKTVYCQDLTFAAKE